MAQEQLRLAHNLIERGRIAEARQLLQNVDDPTARLWLAQLSATRRVRRQGIRLSLPLLVALGIVIGVAMLIVILLLTPTLLSRMQEQTADSAAENALQTALSQYCATLVGSSAGEPCASWVDQVSAQHHAEAVACVAPGIDTPEARAQVSDCFAGKGVPPPV